MSDENVVDLTKMTKKELNNLRLQAEVRQALIEAEKAELEYDAAARFREQADRKERFRFRGHQDGKFFLDDAVIGSTVDALTYKIRAFVDGYDEAKKKDKPGIQLDISSPGGSVFAGWRLYDELRAASHRGHEVTTVVRGMAASMAGVIAQAGDHRIVGPEALLMIHAPSTMTMGNTADIKDEARFLERIEDRFVTAYMSRANTKKISEKKFRENFNRKDWWVSATDSLSYGFCDQIG
jgi:ATP-dependent Clp endopeptidase proteolytic subunit ClpP